MMCTKQQHSSWLLTSYKKEKSEREEGQGQDKKKEGEKAGRGGEEGGRKTGRGGKYLLNAQVNVGTARGRQNLLHSLWILRATIRENKEDHPRVSSLGDH